MDVFKSRMCRKETAIRIGTPMVHFFVENPQKSRLRLKVVDFQLGTLMARIRSVDARFAPEFIRYLSLVGTN